jgi:flagellar biosynthetic protein FliR
MSAISDAQLIAVGWAACRVAGVCIFAPVLASRVVPRRLALGFAVALAVAALPGLMGATAQATDVSLGAFLAGAVAELLTGLVLGFVALLPLAACRSAGALAGVQMGVGFGSLYNGSGGDAEGSSGDGVEYMLGVGAVAMFVWAGGLDSLSLGVLRSFDYLPLAQWPSVAALPALLGSALMACSDLTARVALPVTAVLVAEALVTGLISRSVPALGPVQFGFPVRVAVGLLALAAGMAATQDVLNGASGAALDAAHQWLKGGMA